MNQRHFNIQREPQSLVFGPRFGLTSGSGDGAHSYSGGEREMTKLERLKHEALASCTFREHLMGQWSNRRDHHGMASNYCQRCGQTVSVDTEPPPNGIEIGGEAVAVNCNG